MASIFILIEFVKRIRNIYSLILNLLFPTFPDTDHFDKVTLG